MVRFRRLGLVPLSPDDGLALFDRARATGEALLFPAQLDLAAVRAQARSGMLPAPLRGLVRAPARRAQEAPGSLTRRIASLPEAEREAAVLDAVRGQVAAVLGHSSGEAIDARRPFKDLGFDSLGAVELRNRLTQATGVRLPSTLVFDYPTPAAVAQLLASEVTGDGAAERPSIERELDRVEAMLASISADDGERERLEARLRSFSARVQSFLSRRTEDTP